MQGNDVPPIGGTRRYSRLHTSAGLSSAGARGIQPSRVSTHVFCREITERRREQLVDTQRELLNRDGTIGRVSYCAAQSTSRNSHLQEMNTFRKRSRMT